ncbi:MAG: trigger factor [Actinobacteria bacterium]|nr:MAG: trigger factor [Actinomycetota bacterium]
MTIKTELKKLEKNNVELLVEVPAEEIKKSVSQAYENISKKAKIPGFRTGKIPPQIIDSHFGKDYVKREALQTDLPKYYSQAVNDSKIKPIATPDIEIVKIEENKSLKFKAKVEVEPRVELPNYSEIKVEQKEEKVKKEQVEKQIEAIRDRFAELNKAPAKVASVGDYVLINFDGKVNGKEFEGGSAKNYLLEIGSKTLMPEFEEQLAGTKAGDIKQITFSIPVQNPNKEIAGKTASFKVLVKEVKVKKLPELTDKFVKEIVGFDSVKDLREQIEKDMQQALDKQEDNNYKIEALRQLAQKSKVDIPKSMVEETANQIMNEFEMTLKNQNANKEDYLKARKMTEEDLKKNFIKTAEVRTKEELVLKSIIEKEKLEVTDAEVSKKIDELSKEREKPISKEELEEKDLIGYLKSNILLNKALDMLVTKTTKGDK